MKYHGSTCVICRLLWAACGCVLGRYTYCSLMSCRPGRATALRLLQCLGSCIPSSLAGNLLRIIQIILRGHRLLERSTF
ncbi:hypothetical protein BC834DRAFT_854628 [Gloeopeniophorella convolvens]|nr:hypothetical protein BC834DRAFT_854628 [Gloeopeniophorella convolvens]